MLLVELTCHRENRAKHINAVSEEKGRTSKCYRMWETQLPKGFKYV